MDLLSVVAQEIAVYDDFTIEETLIYFARLYRLSRKEIKERISFLLAFLDLPHKNRLVQNLRSAAPVPPVSLLLFSLLLLLSSCSPLFPLSC